MTKGLTDGSEVNFASGMGRVAVKFNSHNQAVLPWNTHGLFIDQ